MRRLLPFVLLIAACHPKQTITVVPPPPRPVHPEWQNKLSQQNADATLYQHTSAECHRLYEQGYELARIRLEANLRKPHQLPPAVIVDIDETVLDNSPYQVTNVALGRIFAPGDWNDWTMRGSAQALPGALAFLHYADSLGCDIYYISNRHISEKNVTIKNLFELRFPDADDAHVLCMDADSDKTKRRAQVQERHTVALLVGDQLRDFDEVFKDRSKNDGKATVEAMRDTLRDYFILLPNPMYGTWLDALSGKVDSLKEGRKADYFEQHRY